MLAAFVAGTVLLSGMATADVSSAVGSLPRYAANIERLVTGLAAEAGLRGEPAWEGVRD